MALKVVTVDAVSRRDVLRALACGALITAAAPALVGVTGCSREHPSSAPRSDGSWANWSGGQTSHPKRWFVPANEDELVAAVRAHTGTMRVVGSGHSFSPLVATDDVLISLDPLQGVAAHDPATLQATVWAGTRLHDLGDQLWEIGQSLVNQGDIDEQSLGGAVGTSTHGTGATLGSFSAQVRGLRLVTADGSIIECSPDRDADVFHAACTSFGSLGVITQMRLQNRGAYSLRERTYTMPVADILRDLDGLIAQNRHFEFWPFFHASSALVKILNETTDAPTPPSRLALPVDPIFQAACEIAHKIPPLAGSMQRLLMAAAPSTDRVDRSYRIFPSPRTVRFNEMEYELPARHGPACVAEVLAAVRQSGIDTLFPLEYRTVAADDCWLSPFFERPSVAISVHQYYKVDYRRLFSLVEPIFWKYEGRPHWGKLHTLGAKELAALYPKWDAFQAVRRRLDPRGKFLNDHLRQVLGVV